MATNNTILSIRRDPDQLTLLQENGYALLTASNSHDSLRLFASEPVDAIVLDYHLGLLDGTVVANEIKRVQPTIPIVTVADDLELPYDALNSVDALVTKSDGAHFLWATIHFVLNGKPARSREAKHGPQSKPSPAPKDAREWRNIRAGSVQF